MREPRRPRPSTTTSPMPTLAMLLATPLGAAVACQHASNSSTTSVTMTQTNTPPAHATNTPPREVVIRPQDPMPPMLGGAPVMVTPQPAEQQQPAPAPAPAPASAPSPPSAAPSASASAASSAEPNVATARPVRIVHNHAPGAPCAPLTEAQVRAAQRSAQ